MTIRPLLEVTDLSVRAGERILLDRVGFGLDSGERLGLIGESGSGKSLTALSLMGLLPEPLRAGGSITLDGVAGNLVDAGERAWSRLRGDDLAMVFQEPMTALNPLMKVGKQVAEVIALHDRTVGRRERRAVVLDLLASVNLPDPPRIARSYPHELSGGQRQRVLIAIAMANRPRVLICDEPSTALDVTTSAQILELIDTAVREHDTALLFISHDLAVVSQLCERVLVMRGGEIVESGPIRTVFGDPQHPYTRSLLDASQLRPGGSGSGSHESAGEVVFNACPDPLIAVRGLGRTYPGARSSLLRSAEPVRALSEASFDVGAGERFGVVGESGSGKSTLIRMLCALDTPTAGSIRVGGREIVGARERDLRQFRRDVSIVFQDPMGSLDPRMKVGDIVAEPLAGAVGASDRDASDRVAEMLVAVGLEPDMAGRYPHQFSGGQRQRISIARALITAPKILVADEPVSALDVSVRAQVLDLLARLVADYQLTLLLVSHDLAVVRHVCEVVAVMHRGRIVECGPTEEVYERPRDPYTARLIESAPRLVLPDA
ncbi:ABC transporter ATP-binding protein [Rhodococcus spelaei]|uniref:ABC transporter ATP-binding protein n=1 Tax=Rhodococcus spelaei TaxID=2546320 RepID=A0A541B7V3_9NOCA|nr:ABC transporter ATP-binding protein [Rhodococcus spelaei]TQF68399.1 ABC transporter ATP-binding protein [Rhodococcus spelaei]